VFRLSVLIAITFIASAMTATWPSLANAQQPEATPTPEASSAPHTEGGFDLSNLTPEEQEAVRLAIIKISQNPVGNITVLPFQNNFNYGVGPFARFQYNLNIEPVVPIMLKENLNLIARTIFPVIVEPSFAPPTVCATVGCGSTFGIGDVQEELFFAPKTKPGQFVWGAGPALSFPTGSPQDILGSGKWGAGIDAVGLVLPGKWVIGALVTQTWSFAGHPDRADFSNFLVQPFINYNLKHDWAVSTAPEISANFDSPMNKWAVPLGGGISKTLKAGDQLMQVAVDYYSFIERPVTAPQTELRVVWSLLWPVKRGIDIQQLIQQAK
jgi:hypothetical protein